MALTTDKNVDWHISCSETSRTQNPITMKEELKEETEKKQNSTTTEKANETPQDIEQTAPETEQSTQEEEKAPVEPEESEELTVEQQLEAANAEIASLKDQLLRKIAEFENYRKRTIKEKTDLILNGGEKTIITILPVIDDFERALKNMKSADDVNAVLEGVELIYKKFMDILGRQGVSVIETKEADFDVDLHEAVAQLPAPTPELKGKVMDCTQTGYKLNEKVIRHAQVVVGV